MRGKTLLTTTVVHRRQPGASALPRTALGGDMEVVFMSESEPLVEPSKLVFLLAEAIIIHDTMTEAARAYPPGSQERRDAYERFYGEAGERDHLQDCVGEAIAEAAQNGTLSSLVGEIRRLQKATAKLASACVDAEWPSALGGPRLQFYYARRELEVFIPASFGGHDRGCVPAASPADGGKTGTPADSEPAGAEADGEQRVNKQAQPAARRATESYEWVCTKRPDLVPEAPKRYDVGQWNYIRDQGCPAYTDDEDEPLVVPAFETWKRQVRAGCHNPQDPKATPRSSRPHGKSVVSAHQV